MTNENVEIRVFGSATEQRSVDLQDEQQVIRMVREQVLPREKASYYQVNARVKRKEDGSPDYVVVYMLREDSYTADVVKVEVDEQYEAQAFEDDYSDLEEEDEDNFEEGARDSPEYEVEFVVATPVPGIPTAKQAVEYISNMVTKMGFNVKVLLGSEATVANYKKYLASGLKGFVNVGHGFNGGIVLFDDRLTASWFQAVVGKRLAPCVVYFNSCQVFNAPLLPAIMAAGARTYIGGIINLKIGPSEEVCKCFWDNVLRKGKQMKPSLTSCEQTHYPVQGAHGFAGDAGLFNFISSALDNYKVVLYGEDELAGDLEAYIHCFYQGSNVMSCEFYEDGSAMPQNRFKGGRVGLVYPRSQLPSVLDVLRNENPIYFGFILSTKVGYIATHSEPVGEGE